MALVGPWSPMSLSSSTSAQFPPTKTKCQIPTTQSLATLNNNHLGGTQPPVPPPAPLDCVKESIPFTNGGLKPRGASIPVPDPRRRLYRQPGYTFPIPVYGVSFYLGHKYFLPFVSNEAKRQLMHVRKSATFGLIALFRRDLLLNH